MGCSPWDHKESYTTEQLLPGGRRVSSSRDPKGKCRLLGSMSKAREDLLSCSMSDKMPHSLPCAWTRSPSWQQPRRGVLRAACVVSGSPPSLPTPVAVTEGTRGGRGRGSCTEVAWAPASRGPACPRKWGRGLCPKQGPGVRSQDQASSEKPSRKTSSNSGSSK